MDMDNSLDGLTTVTLSRRNLEGLLSQLDDGARDAQIRRRTKSGLLVVLAQLDGAHYHGGERDGLAGASGPGQQYGEQIALDAT